MKAAITAVGIRPAGMIVGTTEVEVRRLLVMVRHLQAMVRRLPATAPHRLATGHRLLATALHRLATARLQATARRHQATVCRQAMARRRATVRHRLATGRHLLDMVLLRQATGLRAEKVETHATRHMVRRRQEAIPQVATEHLLLATGLLRLATARHPQAMVRHLEARTARQVAFRLGTERLQESLARRHPRKPVARHHCQQVGKSSKTPPVAGLTIATARLARQAGLHQPRPQSRPLHHRRRQRSQPHHHCQRVGNLRLIPPVASHTSLIGRQMRRDGSHQRSGAICMLRRQST